MTIPDLGPVRGAVYGPIGLQPQVGPVLDQIRLTGVTARGRHGVLLAERRDGQDFIVDVVLHLDTARAASGDDLAATVDYGAVATRIADIVRGEPVALIETLAARIARGCLTAPGAIAVDVAVHKPQAPIAERFADVAVVIRRERAPAESMLDERPIVPVTAVLALGANLGDRVAALSAAVAALRDVGGLRVDAVSPVVETSPVGGPPQPDYLNAVVLVTTELTPRQLLAACQRVEAGQGREREVRWGPRTLDLDVIRYGDLLSADPELELPHPRAAHRAFVLAPWLAMDGLAWLPEAAGRRPVAPLLTQAPDLEGVRTRLDLRLEVTPEGIDDDITALVRAVDAE
jgi:dihydroneopterin aldolase/2-amino-4-hydroxy-6-hydroxymethyldihydropteridine diphosphokinase